MKKRIFAALLCASMIGAAAGCGNTEQQSTALDSSAPAVSGEQTIPATTTKPKQTETEATTAQTIAEPTIEASVEEEIIPLEISPQSIPKVNSKFSEFAIIATLIYSSTGTRYGYNYICLWFDEESTMDSPLPNSTFIQDWGCYPKVIVSAIESNQSRETIQPSDIVVATDLTGISVDDLYKYIDDGTPVAVWIAKRLKPGETLAKADGITITSRHECAILVGYSDSAVMVWSPFQNDYVTYDREKFEQCFEEQGSFALTITAKE